MTCPLVEVIQLGFKTCPTTLFCYFTQINSSVVSDWIQCTMYCTILFRIHSIGMTCLSAVGIHHIAVVYHSIFQAASGQNSLGHLGNLCLSCFDSSTKGISWKTLQSGSNSNGSGPNKSLNNLVKSSWSRGMSSNVYSLVGFFNPNDLWDGLPVVLYFPFQHPFSTNTTVVGRCPQR